MKNRTRARELCAEFLKRDDPVGWFDALYREGVEDESIIPWASRAPNPLLREWHEKTEFDFRGKRCLKIGCGLGDDAEYLSAAGGVVTAFDIAPTAIDWCLKRYPDTKVEYRVADLFNPQEEWLGAFDFVLEIFTVQALPPEMHPEAITAVSRFVRKTGDLLVITGGRNPDDPSPAPPWPLTLPELALFEAHGLSRESLEDFLDSEDPQIRRFRALYRRTE